MPFDYIVCKEHRLVISTGSGVVMWEEIKARQDQTQTDEDLTQSSIKSWICEA